MPYEHGGDGYWTEITRQGAISLFEMKTVLLISIDAGKPPQCSTRLKRRALMDAGTALHNRTPIPSNPRAELRGKLVAATSSQETGHQVPLSSRLGGRRGAGTTGADSRATNGPQ